MKARKFLVYGFAISLALHLLALPFVRSLPTASATEPEPRILVRTRVPTPPPTPHPTPTPAPTPQPTTRPLQPRQTSAPQAHQVKIVPQRVEPRAGGAGVAPSPSIGGDGLGAPNATPTAATSVASPNAVTPTPLPTPTPLSCARPDVPAATLHAAEPDTPIIAQQQGIFGTVSVVVSLDVQSRVIATRIQSSPSAALNAAALAAARGSRFRTEIKDCAPVAADYIFSVEFSSQ
jgi:periplasmic protein TonB